jgi:hypothetical protein
MVRANKRVRYFECKALRAYWSVHIQAWLRSGISRAEYCRVHRLTVSTMKGWIRALETPIPKRRPVPKKQPEKKLSRVPAMRWVVWIGQRLINNPYIEISQPQPSVLQRVRRKQ